MRALSLVRAWLSGLSAFAAVTAAFVLALSLAISGPPTAEEMTALDDASAAAKVLFADAADGIGPALCASLPALCAGEQRGAGAEREELSSPAPAPDTPAAPLSEPAPEPLPRAQPQAELAGAPNIDAPRRAMRARAETPEGRVRRAASARAARHTPQRSRAARTGVQLRPPVTADVLPERRENADLRDLAPMAPPLRGNAAPPPPTKATRPYVEEDYPSEDNYGRYDEEEAPYPDYDAEQYYPDYEDQAPYYEEDYYRRRWRRRRW